MYSLPHKLTRYGLHQVDVMPGVDLVDAIQAIRSEYATINYLEVFIAGPTNDKEDHGYKIYFKAIEGDE